VLADWIVPGARLFLGGLFIYMGLSKALHPVEFLKLVREYELTQNATLLNLIAATLPWFEIFTGLLLVSGIGVRGAGLLSAGMLIPFTLAVAQRAAAIHEANGTPFCGIRFDCGCGAGEVLICRKLAENIGLIILALLICFVRSPRGALRYSLFSPRN
jgi:uncharacterized membrane protein YphA (DoxX/SURF4 family)